MVFHVVSKIEIEVVHPAIVGHGVLLFGGVFPEEEGVDCQVPTPHNPAPHRHEEGQGEVSDRPREPPVPEEEVEGQYRYYIRDFVCWVFFRSWERALVIYIFVCKIQADEI